MWLGACLARCARYHLGVWRRGLLVFGTVLLAGTVLAWCTRPMARAERDLDRVIEDLRARAVATSFEELVGTPPDPGENGWEEIAAALAWRDGHLADGWEQRVVGPRNYRFASPWWRNASEEDLARLAEFLDGLAPCFVHLEAAAGMPTIRWPLPPRDSDGARDDLPPLRAIEAPQGLLEMRAHGAVEPATRRRAIATLFRMGQRIDERVGPYAGIAAECLLRSGYAALREEFRSGIGDPAAARAELDPLLTLRRIDSMPTAIAAARTGACEYVPQLLDGSAFVDRRFWERARDAAANARAGRNPFAPFLDIDPILAVATISGIDRAAAIPHSWDRSYDEAFLQCLGEQPANFRPATPLHMRIDTARQIDAAIRIARIALAACVYRMEQGEWPRTAAELRGLFPEGELPTDPYTGEGFVWLLEDDALEIRASPWSLRPLGWGTPADDPDAAGLVWRLAPPRAPRDDESR